MKNKIKIILITFGICLVITTFVVVFYDLFIDNIISKNINFKNNNNNRSDFISYLQLIATVFLSLITFWITIITYNLQRKMHKLEENKDKIEKKQSVNNIYYYLEDIINKCADISLDDNMLETIFISKKEYIKDLYFLKGNILNNKQFKLLNNIFTQVEKFINYRDSNAYSQLYKIKPLYKLLIDTNISPTEIKKLKDGGNFNELINIEVLEIICQLKSYLEEISIGNIDSESKNITIKKNLKGFYIKKEYENRVLISDNGKISGKIQKYEPLFTKPSNKINIEHEIIYNGDIKNNLFNGEGTYFYHTQKNGFNGKINSCDLSEINVNFDYNAQLIKKLLDSIKINTAKANFKGTFKDGKIWNGILEYQEKPEDTIISIEIENSDIKEKNVLSK